MSNELSVFQFQSSYDVRIQLINNEPYFCLKDVCNVLDIKNHKDLLAKQIETKGVEKIYLPTNGGKQEITFISEPNLYRVIFRSNKPEAKQFQDWVFNEVLPTIRKTGKYSMYDKSDFITAKQLSDLKSIVHNISNAYFYEESFTQGVWKMIRDVVGVDSVQHIRKDQLHLLKPEIEKMLSVTEQYYDLRKQTEEKIIKKIFRNKTHQNMVISSVIDEHRKFIFNLDNKHQNHLDNFNQKLLSSLN